MPRKTVPAKIVEENGELCTINYNQWREERKEPTVNRRQWRRLVGEKRSQSRLAVGPGFLGLEHKTMEIFAGR